MDSTDTKTRIMDVAEKLFAEKGFSGTSLRNITAAAGTNLASIHYHFGSKEELIKALAARIFDPVNEERTNMLESLEEKYGESSPPLEDIITAFIRPMIKIRIKDRAGKNNFLKLMARIHTEEENLHDMIHEKHMHKICEKFIQVLFKTLPHLSHIELLWRFKFMLGTVMATLLPHPGHKNFNHTMADFTNVDTILSRVVPFIAAGYRAPAPDIKNKKE